MGVYTGTPPTFLTGELPDSTKFDEVTNFMNAATGAWTSWAPTLTNLTLGNGTVTAKYRQLGKAVDYRFKFVLGSTSAVGSDPAFTLPVAPHSEYVAPFDQLGIGTNRDVSLSQSRTSIVLLSSGSTVIIFGYGTTGIIVDMSATVPFTWATGDVMAVVGSYEAA